MKIYTCKYCGKQFEFESDKKAGGFMSAHQRMCELNPKRDYYIQQMKDAWHKGSLTANGKKHIRKSSLGLEHEAACYFLDFKLKNNIDLEIDGKQHKYQERKVKDIERDTLLKKNGWIIYRIEWNEISSEKGSKLMKKKIDDFLQWYHIKCSLTN